MEKIINDLLKNKDIEEFVQKNKLSSEDIINNYPEFSLKETIDNECEKCLKNGTCNNSSQFSKCELVYEDGKVRAKLVDCSFENKGILVTYFDEEIPSDIYFNEARVKVLNELANFKEHINDKVPPKGIFLYGGYGQGKSVIMYNFAKELMKLGKKVIYAYYPDLVRRLKSALGSSEIEAMLTELKKIDILMLDDIGGENNTAFVRDELLGPILQYRMNNYLPTFATSNYTIDALRLHFAETSSELDKLKAGRIIERIRSLMVAYELKDKDYRL